MGFLLPSIHRGSAALHRLPVVFAPLRGWGDADVLFAGGVQPACLQGLRYAPPPAYILHAPTGLGFVISVLPMSVANRSDFDYIDDRHLSGKMWFRDI